MGHERFAVTSYADSLLFGVTADRDTADDIDVLRDALVGAFRDLAVAGEAATQEG